jgi:succinate-acetate transporter protein
MSQASQVTSFPKRETWTKSGPVTSHLPQDEIEVLEKRAAATVADPAPLGFWGFATGTWITGTILAGVFPATALTATIPVLLVFAGLTQFIAGLFTFRRGNILSATAFCSFGAFNVLTALLFGLQSVNKLATTGDPAILQGFVLESFAFIALALTVAALRTNAALVLTLALLSAGYALVGIANLTNSIGSGTFGAIGNIGGWVLVASAFFAYYTGMAIVVNSSWNRTVFPVGGEA